jgi:serine/threonine protein kinase
VLRVLYGSKRLLTDFLNFEAITLGGVGQHLSSGIGQIILYPVERTGISLLGVQNLSGQTLGQYELKELLGAGGMGAVYLAYQTMLERHVAIKVLNIALLNDPDYSTRFIREARTSAALEHPHIVPVYDYGTHNGISYVVMRYLTGGTLAERLNHSRDTGRPLPSLSEVATIVRQLAGALDYAHSRGVIHRDVKANNVMFDDKGTAFLVDFGIAKLMFATSALTGTGTTMGTPSYMAPEQWRGEPATPAVDQYALGVLTYAMLTGRMPFEAETPFALMHKHLNEEPTPLSVFRGDLPDGVRAVLQKVLAKDPQHRYESVSGYANDLDKAIGTPATMPTGFFVTPLPRRALPDVPTAIERDHSPVGKEITSIPPVKLPIPESSSPKIDSTRSRTPLIAGAALFVILIVGGALVALFSAQRAASEADGTATQAYLALLQSETKMPSLEGNVVEASVTAIPEPSTSPTRTASTTPSATPTLDVRSAAIATRAAFQTATAALWTATNHDTGCPADVCGRTYRALRTGFDGNC